MVVPVAALAPAAVLASRAEGQPGLLQMSALPTSRIVSRLLHGVLRARPQAAVNITALADACNRGAEAVASVLLEDDRIDPLAGSDVRQPASQPASQPSRPGAWMHVHAPRLGDRGACRARPGACK